MNGKGRKKGKKKEKKTKPDSPYTSSVLT